MKLETKLKPVYIRVPHIVASLVIALGAYAQHSSVQAGHISLDGVEA